MNWPPIGWSFVRGKIQTARWSLMRGHLYGVSSQSVEKRSEGSFTRGNTVISLNCWFQSITDCCLYLNQGCS